MADIIALPDLKEAKINFEYRATVLPFALKASTKRTPKSKAPKAATIVPLEEKTLCNRRRSKINPQTAGASLHLGPGEVELDLKASLDLQKEQGKLPELLLRYDPCAAATLYDSYLGQLVRMAPVLTTNFEQMLLDNQVMVDDDGETDVGVLSSNSPCAYQAASVLKEADLKKSSTEMATTKCLSKVQVKTAQTAVTYSNYMFLYGIKEIKRYGLLNHPSLPNSLRPSEVNVGGLNVTRWADKVLDPNPHSARASLLADLEALFGGVCKKASNKLSYQSDLIFCISPKIYSILDNSGLFMHMFDTCPNLQIMIVKELTQGKDDTIMVIAPKNDDGEPCFVTNCPTFNVGPFLENKDKDDEPHYTTEITGENPPLFLLRPELILTMTGV